MSYGESLADQFIWLNHAVNRVRQLHKQIPGPYDQYVCEHCTDMYGDSADDVPYPCPTIQALDGEQE